MRQEPLDRLCDGSNDESLGGEEPGVASSRTPITSQAAGCGLAWGRSILCADECACPGQ